MMILGWILAMLFFGLSVFLVLGSVGMYLQRGKAIARAEVAEEGLKQATHLITQWQTNDLMTNDEAMRYAAEHPGERCIVLLRLPPMLEGMQKEKEAQGVVSKPTGDQWPDII